MGGICRHSFPVWSRCRAGRVAGAVGFATVIARSRAGGAVPVFPRTILPEPLVPDSGDAHTNTEVMA